MMAGDTGRGLGPVISMWLFSSATQYEIGSLGREISWTGLLALTLPPLLFSRYLPPDVNVSHRQLGLHRECARDDRDGDEAELGLMERGEHDRESETESD
ncbi:hypothetical protein IAT40_007825 [Kwoniella sp. CBS 6097]